MATGAPVPPTASIGAAAEVSSAYLDALPGGKNFCQRGRLVRGHARATRRRGFRSRLRTRARCSFTPKASNSRSRSSASKARYLANNGAIAFYGTAIDTPFSGTRVYWLVRGSQPGKRIPISTSAGSGASSVQSFLSSVTLEQRTTYFAALLNGPNADNFFGALVNTEPVDQDLAIEHYDPSSSIPAQVTITLQGVTAGQPHSVSVTVNGSSVGVLNFNGQDEFHQHFPDRAGPASRRHQHRHPHARSTVTPIPAWCNPSS